MVKVIYLNEKDYDFLTATLEKAINMYLEYNHDKEAEKVNDLLIEIEDSVEDEE